MGYFRVESNPNKIFRRFLLDQPVYIRLFVIVPEIYQDKGTVQQKNRAVEL